MHQIHHNHQKFEAKHSNFDENHLVTVINQHNSTAYSKAADSTTELKEQHRTQKQTTESSSAHQIHHN
jgi:hypothetical protein